MNHLTIEHNTTSLIKFAFPSVISLLCMSCYEMVDGIFVANLVNADALAALNIVYPPISLLIGISIMLATGGSAIIAKKLGEKKEQEARENFTMMVLVGIGFGLLCIVLNLLFMENIVVWLGGTQRLFRYAYDYIFIMGLASPFAILQLLFMTFFVTAGKPHLGMVLTVISGMSNVVLDYLFMGPMGMGVEGAAIATGIGYSISAVAGLVFFWRNKGGLLYFVRPKWDGKVLGRACSNGMSEMVSSLATAVTTLLYNYLMLKFAGEDGVAAISIILYAQFLLSAVYLGFSSGVAPVISYNYGNKNVTQLKRIFKICLRTILVMALITIGAAYLLGDFIVAIFTGQGTHIFELAESGFKIFAFSFLFSGFNIFVSALFTALSNGVISAGISFLRTFIVLVGCLLILPVFLGITGVWLAVPVSEVVTIVISLIFVFAKRKTYEYL